jgi:DNA repair exonuclease SbcCD ATPase subunit
MYQTETLLLVVLGFALASLIALFIGRFFWSIAIRLGARRMQKQVPSTVKDLQADRDRLRADYALVSQKLGSHLDQVKTRMAEQMAEVSRSRNRIQSLTEDVNVRDAEIALLKQRIGALETEVAGKATEMAKLQSELSERSQTLNRIETDLASAALAAVPGPAVTGDGLQDRIQKLADLSGEIAEGRKKSGDATAPSLPPDLDAKLAAAELETAELQKELARLDAAWSEKLKAIDGGTVSDQPAVANVVSLANRMRDLQKDAAG